MSQNLPFTKCLHPVEVKTLRGLQLVKCGKCPACQNSLRSELRAKVQYEETHSLATYFLTLTYDDSNLPLFALRADSPCDSEDSLNGSLYRGYDGVSYAPVYTETGKQIKGVFHEYDVVHLKEVRTGFFPLNDRIQTDRHSKLLDSWSYDIDNDIYSGCILRSATDSDSWSLEEYHSRLKHNVAECKKLGIVNNSLSWYKSRFSDIDKFGCTADDCIPLLYYADFQRFMKRLRKLITKLFGKDEKIRYYAIGEYGTSSFRPHWHILLFTDSHQVSDWLHKSFVKDELRSKRNRTIYTSDIIRTLWKFGACTIDKTDGKASGYLSNYVVGSSELPQLLQQLAPQKAFHSVRFGCPYTKDEVGKMLRERDYDKFTEVSYQDTSTGAFKSRPLWRSYYSLFFPQFVGINSLDDYEKFRVLKVYPKLIREFGSLPVHELSKKVYRCIYNDSIGLADSREHEIATFFDWFHMSPATKLSLSPIDGILYASKRFLTISRDLGFTPREYFDVWRDFVNWRDAKCLAQHYADCQINEIYLNDYYNIYGGAKLNLDYLKDSSLFKVFIIDTSRQYDKLVKHKKLVEQLKGI